MLASSSERRHPSVYYFFFFPESLLLTCLGIQKGNFVARAINYFKKPLLCQRFCYVTLEKSRFHGHVKRANQNEGTDEK